MANRCIKAWALLGLLLAPAATARAEDAKPRDETVTVGDFRFADGETLPTLVLHAVTLGTPVRDAANAVTNGVLLLHGTTGDARQFLAPDFQAAMFGPGQPLDLRRVYVIIPDGIGAGQSTKPSDGLGGHFPHYGYGDQVRAHRLLADRLGAHHLKLVLGTSMGGMQAWLWGERYPRDADALIAVASTPAAISGRNMMWRAMVVQAIEADPEFHGGDYPKDRRPTAWLRTAIPLFTMMTGNPEHLQDLIPTRGAAAGALDGLAAKARAVDADDYLYSFQSSADYDPAPDLPAIVAPMLAVNFEDDLLNPPELLRLPESATLQHVMLPAGPASFGHQTLGHPALWAKPVAAFLATVPGWTSAGP